MTLKFETICIVGLGYIGLPTAAIFASRKIKVIGVDVNPTVVDTVNQGKIHIVEPDLDMIVHATVSEGYLQATANPQPAQAFLIAVPTPFIEESSGLYQPNMAYIEAASKAIAPVLKKGDLVVLESTSPVGATEQMADWLAEARSDLTFPQTHGEDSDIRIAHCPERVLPGHVLRELVQNDRVVGGMTHKCSEVAIRLYKTIVKGDCIITNVRTAEMCKLTENSFRDVNIAFANELSIICDKFGINVWELIRLANRHPRVNILQPGPGVGGHCIAVDPWFIVSAAPDQAKLIRAAREVNDRKPEWVIEKIKLSISDYLLRNPGKTSRDVAICCLGLAFKQNIDDLRESPSLDIALKLAEILPGRIIAVEPNITELPVALKNVLNLKSLDKALAETQIVVMLVAHKEFQCIDRVLKVDHSFLNFCASEDMIVSCE